MHQSAEVAPLKRLTPPAGAAAPSRAGGARAGTSRSVPAVSSQSIHVARVDIPSVLVLQTKRERTRERDRAVLATSRVFVLCSRRLRQITRQPAPPSYPEFGSSTTACWGRSSPRTPASRKGPSLPTTSRHSWTRLGLPSSSAWGRAVRAAPRLASTSTSASGTTMTSPMTCARRSRRSVIRTTTSVPPQPKP